MTEPGIRSSSASGTTEPARGKPFVAGFDPRRNGGSRPGRLQSLSQRMAELMEQHTPKELKAMLADPNLKAAEIMLITQILAGLATRGLAAGHVAARNRETTFDRIDGRPAQTLQISGNEAKIEEDTANWVTTFGVFGIDPDALDAPVAARDEGEGDEPDPDG